MTDSRLDSEPVGRAIYGSLGSDRRLGTPGWVAGARLTFAEPELSAAGIPHHTAVEILVVAHADTQRNAVGPVGEFVHSSGRSSRLAKAAIAALGKTAMPLGGASHPAAGSPVGLEDPLTTRAESEDELVRYTVCDAAYGYLQRMDERRDEEARYVAELSSEVTQSDSFILVRGVAGPGPCAWCAHRTLERVAGSSITIPSGWPRSDATEPSYDEFVTLGRFDRRHTFMTAYLRAMNLASSTELVQLLLCY